MGHILLHDATDAVLHLTFAPTAAVRSLDHLALERSRELQILLEDSFLDCLDATCTLVVPHCFCCGVAHQYDTSALLPCKVLSLSGFVSDILNEVVVHSSLNPFASKELVACFQAIRGQ